jgi:copper transport protein
VRNFSRVAAICVGVLIVTGLMQTVRLVGNPTNLLDVNHGRYLVAQVAVLAAMLGLANANRRRVDARLNNPTTIDRHLGALRRSIFTEFAIGLVIVAITAAMVVSPPATSQVETGAPTANQSELYYIL